MKEEKAREGVEALGTNALPYYLKLLSTKDDARIKQRFCELVEKLPGRRFSFTRTWLYSASRQRGIGMLGLMILGPEAKPAVPALTRLFLESQDEDQRGRAATALQEIDLEALGPLTNAVANRDPKIRARAVIALRAFASSAPLRAQHKPSSAAEIELAEEPSSRS